MKTKQRTRTGIYAFLEASGILEHGTNEDIQKVRKEYWALYRRQWRKDKRKKEQAFTISFTDTELKVISEGARKHKLSRTAFIKQAALAYVTQRYLVPDIESINAIKLLLTRNYSVLEEFFDMQIVPFDTGIALMQRIEDLEKHVIEQLVNPKLLESDH